MATSPSSELARNAAAPANGFESPYVKELQKTIRNISKKLASTHKTDSIVSENPGVTLDELVAQRKINADQKASALKKPQLQAQLAQLEEQVQQYRKFDTDHQSALQQQKEELEAKHRKELKEAKEEAKGASSVSEGPQLKDSLLLFSQFLRAAAAKRTEEDNVESDENRAFEGILLLVYGGDQKAVDAAVKIIEGSDEKAPSIDGTPTGVSYGQVKQASIDHSPFQHEEAWVDSVAEATAANGEATLQTGSDPTIANAGLTELANLQTTDALASQTLLTGNQQTSTTEASNKAADRWDSDPVAGGAESGGLEESYEVIPRPDEEVDIPAAAAIDSDPASAGNVAAGTDTAASASWADQVPATEAWGPKAVDNQVNGTEGDGFQKVPGRTRGSQRGGSFHRGDGEHRGRGRGRGGRGGFGGRGRGEGEFRGRGGRGRGGPRGESTPRGS